MQATKTAKQAKTFSVVSIKMVREEAIEYNESVTDACKAAKILFPFFKDADRELFFVLSLNNQREPISVNMVSMGTLTASLVDPLGVFKPAILSNARSIVLAHNHPAGNPKASPADIKVTKRLMEAGRILGVPVDDHIIICGATEHDYISFRDEGVSPWH